MEKKIVMPGIKIRQEVLKKRIEKGVETEKISKEELQILKEKASTYKETKSIFMKDGKLDKQERIELHKMLNKGSKLIAKMKHGPELIGPPDVEPPKSTDIIT